MRRVLGIAACIAPALLAACQTNRTPAPGPATTPAAPLPSPAVAAAAQPTLGWRDAVEPEDHDRLDRLDAAWAEGLAMARRAGFGRAIADLGALLDPAAALPRPDPPPGPYRCRVVRLGVGTGARAFAAYPAYFCHVAVDGTELAFTKQGGSELPAGYIWKEGETRSVFLGTMMFAGEAAPPAYGEVAERNLVGVVERIGPLRYRLVLPWTRAGARIDVIELVPYVPPEL
jgi:hypothetical protein